MEMPCRCSCGNWFDLHDGYASRGLGSRNVVCGECHSVDEEIDDILSDIEFLETQPHKKREIKKLQKRLKELGYDDETF